MATMRTLVKDMRALVEGDVAAGRGHRSLSEGVSVDDVKSALNKFVLKKMGRGLHDWKVGIHSPPMNVRFVFGVPWKKYPGEAYDLEDDIEAVLVRTIGSENKIWVWRHDDVDNYVYYQIEFPKKAVSIYEDVRVVCGHRGLSEARIDEASGSGRTWADFEGDALEMFCKEVAAGIKKLAGGHAESVNVERSRNTVWVEYKGQNRSDFDLEWQGSLVTGTGDGHEVLINASWKAADGLQRVERDVRMRAGMVTAQNVVNLFAEAFGR